jgi:hypothetical protein
MGHGADIGLGSGLACGARPKNNPPGGGGGAGAAAGTGTRRRLLFAALALGQQPTPGTGTAIKVPRPCWSICLSISIIDPTCAIAGRDGSPLGERHESSFVASVPKKNELLPEGVRGVALKTHPLFTKCVHGSGRRCFPREVPHLICSKFYAFTCYCKK